MHLMKSLRPLIHLTSLGILCAHLTAADTSSPALKLSGAGDDSEKIDYAALPVLKGEHAVVCPYDEQWKFQLHNYLLYHDGKFWCMWSHGPEVEDMPTQHVRYATSDNGLQWS